MTCEEFRQRLSEYVDGELSQKESANMETHMHGCENCRKEYDVICAMSKAIRDTQDISLPPDFSIEIPKENRLHTLWRRYEKTAAVLVAAVALGIFIRGISDRTGFINDNITKPAPSPTPTVSASFGSLPKGDGAEKEDSVLPNSTPAQSPLQQDAKASAQPQSEIAVTPLQETQSEIVPQNTPSPTALPQASVPETTEVTPASIEPTSTMAPVQSTTPENKIAAEMNDRNSTTMSASPKKSSRTGNGGGDTAFYIPEIDISEVINYAIPPVDKFESREVFDSFKARLDSIISRLSSASAYEKQSLMNEFYALRDEIDESTK